eukprot:CAMPEP_0119302768 /NCGR_PEP_ID=MMETSP1333-20130426/4315_1 /TAXON_ID=418940 /ORGANISM="Scyphosphaera apsteinii, Strain RCC1455" /LENGTH=149 /DNA_ID=CAMNT_0007305233 /DNA_START=113 /DNA_END=559 /DNA_ORIENTATION=+
MSGFSGSAAAHLSLASDQWRIRIKKKTTSQKVPSYPALVGFSVDGWIWRAHETDSTRAHVLLEGMQDAFGRPTFGHVPKPGKRFYQPQRTDTLQACDTYCAQPHPRVWERPKQRPATAHVTHATDYMEHHLSHRPLPPAYFGGSSPSYA